MQTTIQIQSAQKIWSLPQRMNAKKASIRRSSLWNYCRTASPPQILLYIFAICEIFKKYKYKCSTVSPPHILFIQILADLLKLHALSSDMVGVIFLSIQNMFLRCVNSLHLFGLVIYKPLTSADDDLRSVHSWTLFKVTSASWSVLDAANGCQKSNWNLFN